MIPALFRLISSPAKRRALSWGLVAVALLSVLSLALGLGGASDKSARLEAEIEAQREVIDALKPAPRPVSVSDAEFLECLRAGGPDCL